VLWRDGLDSRRFVVGNDRHSLDGFARLGGGSVQNLDLAINAQNLGHLLLELGIAKSSDMDTIGTVAIALDFPLMQFDPEMSRSLLNIAKRPLPLTLRGVGLTSKDAVS
jgi:hypothetical protein